MRVAGSRRLGPEGDRHWANLLIEGTQHSQHGSILQSPDAAPILGAAVICSNNHTSARCISLAAVWPSAVERRAVRSVASARQLKNARHSVLCCHWCAAFSALALADC